MALGLEPSTLRLLGKCSTPDTLLGSLFAKRLKSLALKTILDALKVFTGEMNKMTVALVFLMNDLHTQ